MTLVDDGLLDLPTPRLTSGPAAALQLSAGRLQAGQPADTVLFDPHSSTWLASWYSKGRNCPFMGHCLPGSVRYTLVDGHISYGPERRRPGRLLARSGPRLLGRTQTRARLRSDICEFSVQKS